MKTNCLVIAHNRPECLKKVLASISPSNPPSSLKSPPSPQSLGDLYLFCDGPCNEKTLTKTKEITEIFNQEKKKRNNRNTHILVKENNLGPRDGPLYAINWFLENAKQGCILEEDVVPNENFLTFYGTCLELFKNDEKITLISAAPKNAETIIKKPATMSKLFLPWGWATWQHKFEKWELPKIGSQDSHFSTFSKRFKIANKFQSLVTKLYFLRELNMLNKNPHYVWSYYIQKEIIKNQEFTIVPKTKFTQNIGFSKESLRTKNGSDILPNNILINTISKSLKCKESIEYYQKNKDIHIEKLKYGNLIIEIRAWLKLKSRIRLMFNEKSTAHKL